MDDLQVGDAILFMKVGTHANEDLSDIIARKRQEIDETGFAMWGYGGNTCHPATMVRPFAASHANSSRPIKLVMQPMKSRHFAEAVRAESYSINGTDWQAIPSTINVLGSRYALCIADLKEAAGQIPLGHTRVAIGNSRGRRGDAYLRGQVDKACLEVTGEDEPGPIAEIGLVADLVEPYAVFLK